MRVTFIGHATLLIEMGGVRVLTDPNFDPKLGRFLPRVTPPSMAPREVPPVDALLITHAHADHLSFDALRELPKPRVAYAPPSIARWLTSRGHEVRAAEPGAILDIGRGVRVHVARATHQGARYWYDRWRSDANMYLIENADESCLFVGDTALASEAPALVRRVLNDRGRRLDLALLPIGWAPKWKLGFRKGHLTSADALELFTQLDARHFMPYHWGTFRHVTATAFDAIDRLRVLVKSHHRGADVRVIQPGEQLVVEPGTT